MRMTQNPTFETMYPFDTNIDNWSAYIERIEQFFMANDITDEK